MAWKNLTQTSLAGALIHQHDAITELDELNQLIDGCDNLESKKVVSCFFCAYFSVYF